MKAAFLLCCLLTSSAFGSVITFDDLTGCGPHLVPNGYNGLAWYNLWCANGTVSGAGYATALTSSPNVAYNADGDPASIISATPFIFSGASLAAAWNDGLTLIVGAKNGAVTVGILNITLDTTHKTTAAFNFGPITELDFSSFGGTPNPNFASLGNGTEFAIDNLAISATPEPTTFTLILLLPVLLLLATLRAGLSPASATHRIPLLHTGGQRE